MDKEKELQELLKSEDRFRYMMLSRMKQDCNYYLGNGGRHAKHLWAQEEEAHIYIMKGLHNSFGEKKKPEWLTWEELLAYEEQMVK